MSRPEIFASVFEHFASVFLHFPECDEVTLWKQDVETIILDKLLLAPQVRSGRASDRRATLSNRSQNFLKFLFRFLEFLKFHFLALGWKWGELVLNMVCKWAWARRFCAWAKLFCSENARERNENARERNENARERNFYARERNQKLPKSARERKYFELIRVSENIVNLRLNSVKCSNNLIMIWIFK